MRVVLDENTARAVARRIQACRGEQAELARRLDALPLYGDMGAWLLLRRDGELIALAHETGEVSPAGDDWGCVALVAGAEKFPELACLVPPRPGGATDCAACGGTGRIGVEGLRLRCGTCHTLGWVVPPARP